MLRISQILAAAATAVFHDIAVVIESAQAVILDVVGPEASKLLAADVSSAKQFASDALTIADSSLASHHQAIALAVEQAIDTELALITGNTSVPFNKITNDFLDRLGDTAEAAAHNTILSLKARLAQNTKNAQTNSATTPSG